MYNKSNINGYNRVCYVGTIYSLLVYLCQSTYEEILNTIFIVEDFVPNEIRKNLPNCILLKAHSKYTKRWYIEWIYWRIIKLIQIPNLHGKTIFANDHLSSSPIILSNLNYFLIEDSAFVCSHYFYGTRKNELDNLKKNILYPLKKILFGPILYKHNGDNHQCIGYLQTTQDYVTYMENRQRIICTLNDKWKDFDVNKQNIIKRIYNLTDEDINTLTSRKVIIFTQPLYVDYLTKEEHKRIYEKIINHYAHKDIIIKTHPRDNFDYSSINTEMKVFSKKIPSQIFDLLGIKYTVAAAVYSSTVTNFDYPLQIDWYGTEISEPLFKRLGHIEGPKGSNVPK